MAKKKAVLSVTVDGNDIANITADGATTDLFSCFGILAGTLVFKELTAGIPESLVRYAVGETAVNGIKLGIESFKHNNCPEVVLGDMRFERGGIKEDDPHAD